MMLAHPLLNSLLRFDGTAVNTLVIENPAFFREFLRDFSAQTEGYSGKIVLSKADTEIPISKNAELIEEILNFNINRKSLLTKILARLEQKAVSAEQYLKTAELTAALENYVAELSFDLPCRLGCSKISFAAILKTAGIEVTDDYENDLERILDYMELVREFDRSKLFAFVNLRSFYSEEELEAFFVSVLDHEYAILLVDSSAGTKLPLERRVTIDKDLCEF